MTSRARHYVGLDSFYTNESVRVPGIEPGSFAWEANVLPLNHTRIRSEPAQNHLPPRERRRRGRRDRRHHYNNLFSRTCNSECGANSGISPTTGIECGDIRLKRRLTLLERLILSLRIVRLRHRYLCLPCEPPNERNKPCGDKHQDADKKTFSPLFRAHTQSIPYTRIQP